MNSFNKVYAIEELASQGFDSEELKKGTTIKHLNKIFVRASNHPKQFKELALEEQNNYIESGFDSFVVESRFYLTIWKEEKQKNPSEIFLNTSNNSELNKSNTAAPTISLEDVSENQPENEALVEEIPIKESITPDIKYKVRKYRGSDY